MSIEVIIFDNDGVLIDSEILWHQVNAKELSRLGFSAVTDKPIQKFLLTL